MSITMTVEELRWNSMTDQQKRESLHKLLSDNSFGRLVNTDGAPYELSMGQIKSATALLNKLEADKRSLEVAFRSPIEELEDAELVATLAHVRNLLAGRTTGGRALDS
jgi:hypothetical protein